MKLYLYCFFLLMLFQGHQIVNAQIHPPDSTKEFLNETIIYEYDTVYVAPDTIRLVDTVVHILPAQVKPIKLSTSHWGFAINYSLYMSNIFDKGETTDSFSVAKVLNHEIDLQGRYRYKNLIFSPTIGYLTIQEQINYKYNYFTTGENASGVYDSLLVKSAGVITNYYNYLNLSLGIERVWNVNRFSFFCSLYAKASLLESQDATFPDNYINSSKLKKIGYAAVINAGLAYHLSKKIKWQLSPFFQYRFSDKKEYPLGNLKVIGLKTGLIFFK